MNNIVRSKPLGENLCRLLEYVNRHFDSKFNGVLVNKYISGEDNIGKHSDDEKGRNHPNEG